jgi:hypothetical protein
MTEFPVPLDNLIAYVKALHPGGGPLENVSDAFRVSNQLDEQADALIGYFVDQARKSGLPWSQIGAAMGVTKQAAQKRFVPGKAFAELMAEGPARPFSRFTDRAVRVIAAAGVLSAAAPIRPAHLAAALLTEPEGVAAKVITAAGVPADQLYAALGTGPAPEVADSAAALRPAVAKLEFDDDAKPALKGALRSALHMSHNYIGTEHLLLGIVALDDPAARALASLGLTQERVAELLKAEFAAIQAAKAAK